MMTERSIIQGDKQDFVVGDDGKIYRKCRFPDSFFRETIESTRKFFVENGVEKSHMPDSTAVEVETEEHVEQ